MKQKDWATASEFERALWVRYNPILDYAPILADLEAKKRALDLLVEGLRACIRTEAVPANPTVIEALKAQERERTAPDQSTAAEKSDNEQARKVLE